MLWKLPRLLEGGRESPHSNNLLGLAMGEGPWRATSMLGIYLKFCKFHDDVGQMVSLLCSRERGVFLCLELRMVSFTQ